MKAFWTVTDVDSDTNSRNTRFENEEAAIRRATSRLQSHCRPPSKGVVILKAVKLVRFEHPPVTVEDIVIDEQQPGKQII